MLWPFIAHIQFKYMMFVLKPWCCWCVGLFATVFLIDLIGRKATMALEFLLFGAVCFILFICVEG